MSKPSRRANRTIILQKRKEAKKATRRLSKEQQDKGCTARAGICICNAKSEYETVQEETDDRTKTVAEQARAIKTNLPVILKNLAKIPDPRNPKKIKHKHTVLLMYGILMFVLQMSSRRQVNKEMTRPVFIENLRMLFPEIEDIPHGDTLMRLLAKIDVGQIGKTQIDLVRSLIRKKKFRRYLINGQYPVVIDGTQKFSRDFIWSEECSERKTKNGQDKQYYVYVLEASLGFQNGMSIPLMSEFLNYSEGDTETEKQDCEINAFKRLSRRLKAEFKRLPILLLLDGLYANGPVMAICRNNRWGFMIVLQNKSLSSVWEEYNGLKDFVSANRYRQKWSNRQQSFRWVNQINYHYDKGEMQIVHVVVCEEQWEEIDKQTCKPCTKTSRHAWLSSEKLNAFNLHERCNLGARHRWNIENEFLVEKRFGYQYEHCFSYNWNAMVGYHYLMRIGYTLNILAHFSETLFKKVRRLGVTAFVKFVRETIAGPWLDSSIIRQLLSKKYQLRLI